MDRKSSALAGLHKRSANSREPHGHTIQKVLPYDKALISATDRCYRFELCRKFEVWKCFSRMRFDHKLQKDFKSLKFR